MKAKTTGQILAIFLLAGCIAACFEVVLFRMQEDQQKRRTTAQLADIRSGLEAKLTRDLLLVQQMAAYIGLNPDLDRQSFEHLATQTLRNGESLAYLEIAPDYTVTWTWPRQETGRDLLTRDAGKAALPGMQNSAEVLLYGPVTQADVQWGFMASSPVFISEAGQERFWGVMSGLLDMNTLLPQTRAAGSSLRISLRFKNPANRHVPLVWGEGSLFTHPGAVLMDVNFPYGSWELAALPRVKLSMYSESHWWIRLISLAAAVLLCAAAVKAQKNFELLTNTGKLLDESQSIAHLGSWKTNSGDTQYQWSKEMYSILGVNPADFTPSISRVLSLIHPDDKKTILQELDKAWASGTEFNIEHRIIRGDNNEVRYVQGRGKVLFDGYGEPKYMTGTLLDITDRKTAELALEERENMISAMAEASLDALIAVNARDDIIFWSSAAETMFGWTKQEVVGKKMHDLLVPPDKREQAKKGIQVYLKTGYAPVLGSVHEFSACTKNGQRIPIELAVAPFILNNERHAVGSLRDISERKTAVERLQQLVITDELTGIYSRRHFLNMAEKEVQRSLRHGTPFSLIMFDADAFKNINDTYGHSAGDLVLKSIAETAKSVLREIDLLGRLGGEEFAVGLLHTDLAGALDVAERLRLFTELATVRPASSDYEIRCTISLGVAALSPDYNTLQKLLHCADTAMYEAKRQGRNRAVACSHTVSEPNPN